jgi:hypothetical protein
VRSQARGICKPETSALDLKRDKLINRELWGIKAYPITVSQSESSTCMLRTLNLLAMLFIYSELSWSSANQCKH